MTLTPCVCIISLCVHPLCVHPLCVQSLCVLCVHPLSLCVRRFAALCRAAPGGTDRRSRPGGA